MGQTEQVEALGRIQHDEQHQLIFGLYTQPAEKLTVKFGLGTAVGIGKPLKLFRTGVVWRF
jgi:hypothetical protein